MPRSCVYVLNESRLGDAVNLDPMAVQSSNGVHHA